jgi:hypothetical protein
MNDDEFAPGKFTRDFVLNGEEIDTRCNPLIVPRELYPSGGILVGIMLERLDKLTAVGIDTNRRLRR